MNLSAKQQDWLAEVARKAAGVKYDAQFLSNMDGTEFASLGEWFALHIIEKGGSPQDFGDMYDKLHRSGANK